MQLPNGYAAETVCSWSLSNAPQWMQDTSTWAWEELNGAYLVPMVTPDSFPRSWSRHGSVAGLPSPERGSPGSDFNADARPCSGNSVTPSRPRHDNSRQCETAAESSSTPPIPIRKARNSHSRRCRESPPQYQRWRAADPIEIEPDMAWDARQRYEQRYPLTQLRIGRNQEQSTVEQACQRMESTPQEWKRAR